MDLTHCKEIRLSAPPGWTFASPTAQKPRPPILIGGNGRLLLALAAREADIVGFSGLTFRKGGAAPPDLSGWRVSGGGPGTLIRCAGQRIAAPLGAATDNPHYRGPAAKIPDVRPRVLILGSRVEGRFHGPQRGCDAHRG